jgi:hypothetical protein
MEPVIGRAFARPVGFIRTTKGACLAAGLMDSIRRCHTGG